MQAKRHLLDSLALAPRYREALGLLLDWRCSRKHSSLGVGFGVSEETLSAAGMPPVCGLGTDDVPRLIRWCSVASQLRPPATFCDPSGIA